MDMQNPEYNVYIAQKHRFALNDCELTYNEKPFKLGMTLKEAEQVFGKSYNLKQDVIEFNNSGFILWYENKVISGIKLFINNKTPQLIKIKDAFLKNEERMQDFILRSELDFEDFNINSDGYNLINNNCNYRYDYVSQVAYHRLGTRHTYTKDDWKLDETNPVEAISIYKISE